MADRTGGLRGAWSEVIALLPTPRCFTCRLQQLYVVYSIRSALASQFGPVTSNPAESQCCLGLREFQKFLLAKNKQSKRLCQDNFFRVHRREGVHLNILIQLIHASPSLPIGAGIFFQTPHRTHTNALPCFALA